MSTIAVTEHELHRFMKTIVAQSIRIAKELSFLEHALIAVFLPWAIAFAVWAHAHP